MAVIQQNKGSWEGRREGHLIQVHKIGDLLCLYSKKEGISKAAKRRGGIQF
jgi:hypothetical protein